MGDFSQKQCRKKPIPIWRKCNGRGDEFCHSRSLPSAGLSAADPLMPQEALFAREAHSMQVAARRALLRRGSSGNAAFSKTEAM